MDKSGYRVGNKDNEAYVLKNQPALSNHSINGIVLTGRNNQTWNLHSQRHQTKDTGNPTQTHQTFASCLKDGGITITIPPTLAAEEERMWTTQQPAAIKKNVATYQCTLMPSALETEAPTTSGKTNQPSTANIQTTGGHENDGNTLLISIWNSCLLGPKGISYRVLKRNTSKEKKGWEKAIKNGEESNRGWDISPLERARSVWMGLVKGMGTQPGTRQPPKNGDGPAKAALQGAQRSVLAKFAGFGSEELMGSLKTLH
ncbi:hypothetical protein DFH27DRAFT_617092 [Peziza echinospora]|nr:hypothetical protein DFH27DRAFT_617092 [Peziza echinospora]